MTDAKQDTHTELNPVGFESAIAAHSRILAISASHGDKILIAEIIRAYLTAIAQGADHDRT